MHFQPPETTAAELARRLEGELAGDGDRKLTGVAPLDEAGPSDLSWATDERYLRQASTSRAGAIIAPGQAEAPPGLTLIRVKDAELALCRALECFGAPLPLVPPGIHPSAIVDPGATVEGACIGPNVYVGPNAVVAIRTQLHAGVYVGYGARIGQDCTLWPNVVVRDRVIIGDRVVIHPNSTIGADGFGYLPRRGRHHKVPQIGTVEIGDDVEIGANSAVDRAKCGVTRIGRGTKIDNLVQVGHNVRIGEDCIIVAECGISGSCVIQSGVVLAGQVGLSDHVTVESGAIVGAKSLVTKDLPGRTLYRGIPAQPAMEFSRQQAALRKLPALLAEMRELRKRIEQLESTTDHRKGS